MGSDWALKGGRICVSGLEVLVLLIFNGKKPFAVYIFPDWMAALAHVV